VRMLSPDDEDEIERMYQKLKALGTWILAVPTPLRPRTTIDSRHSFFL
jgi:hypothetical protein